MSNWEEARRKKAFYYATTLSGEAQDDGEITEKTLELYRKAVKEGENILHGHGVKRVIAASVLLASRIYSSPRSAKEIAQRDPDDNSLTARDILTTSKKIRDELSLGTVVADFTDTAERILTKLNAGKPFRQETQELLSTVSSEQVVVGLKPTTVAASAIYVVSRLLRNEDIRGDGRRQKAYTQKEIARVAQVSTVSIRNSYPEIATTARQNGYTFGEYYQNT